MSSSPTVVVKKGGVLSTLVSGLFATLIVCIVCGAGIGLYALNMADRKFSEFIGGGKTVLAALPELRQSLCMVGDLLNDRRAPDYRDQLDTSVQVARPAGSRDARVAVIEVTNKGPETVTYLTARVVASDQAGVPVHEYRTFIATPVGLAEDQWRGPLLPGAARRFTVLLWDCPVDTELTASLELTDLRIWNRDQAPQAASPAAAVPSVP